MKRKLLLIASIFTIAINFASFTQVPVRKGWWKFDTQNNKLLATVGKDLELNGTMEGVSGPATGNNAVLIPVGSYLTMLHGLQPNGGGEKVNEYSLQIDFSIPEGEIWHSFFQLTSTNTDDGDLFTNTTNHIGVWEAGYSDSTITTDTWYRMLLTVKNGEFFRIYINGYLWVDAAGRDIDSRYALMDTIQVFADNDGEDGDIMCSELGIWDVALTQEEVTELGNTSASVNTGIINKPIANKTSELGLNYPNPFSKSTTFPYQIQKAGNVSFRIFDLTGKEVQRINEGVKSPGKYSLKFTSEKLLPGAYYFQMISNEETSLRKIIVVR
jgi:hypothetical protein